MQTTSTDLGATLSAAIAGGYVAETSGQTFTVSAPIVINVNSTIQGPLGIDLGGAKIVSQITNGAPVIQINAGPGVDLRYLTLSNFTIEGNGREGDGIKIVADGNDRWIYNFSITNVTVKNVGGYGLDVQGSVFEGLVSNSWMTGNHAGGAYFGHSSGGGQVSALRWYGGGLEGNGGAGLMLANGARDMMMDGVSVATNNGFGISAEYGITAVSNSQFRDNRGDGIWFQNYGNFTNNTFTSSGVQAIGIDTWLNGGATLIGNTSVYTGSGTNPTTLANLQGYGNVYAINDVGKVVTGSQVAMSGLGAGNVAQVSPAGGTLSMSSMAAVTAATTAAVANSTGTGTLETALRTALTGGTVAHLSGATFTVTTPIVINLTGSSQGPIGIDLGGAKIISQVAGGGPVIEIIAGPGVDVSALTLSNFMIQGSGQEGAGIKIVADGADRSINLKISNVNVEHVGGIGLDVLGNVSGTVFDSWMHGNGQGGARFANSAGGGTADGLQWVGGGFRKNGVAGLILANGAHDMTVQGAYFVENYGAGIQASSGITRVEQTGFENNTGVGAWVGGSSTFFADTFSTYGPQATAIGGVLSGGKIVVMGTGNEYYGGGADPTALVNVQGSGTLSIAGGGRVLAGSGISVTGGSALNTTPVTPTPVDTTPPAVLAVATAGTGIVSGDGALNAGKTVTLTATFSEVVTVAGGTPTLSLNDGGTATYTGGSGSTALTFSHVVQPGQNVADLAVTSLAVNGATIKDAAGNAANLAGAAGLNPAGTLKIDTVAPTVGSIATSGPSITGGGGTLGVGATVTFTVAMSEAVTVTGTPTLALSTGGTATYSGGSGSSALSFTHTVAAGQSAADLTVTSMALNGGTIGDAAGNAASLAGAANYNPAGTLKVDTTVAAPPADTIPPAVQSIATAGTGIVSGSGTLNAGNTVTLTATFSEAVTVAGGTPTLSLNDGGTATYTGGSGGATLTFSHVVQAGQNAADLAVTSLALNGATIKDAAGNAANLAGAANYNPAGTLKVDTTVTSGSASGPGPVGGPAVTARLSNDTGSSASDRFTANAALTGSGDPNAVVRFTVDGQAIAATATANATGAWSFTPGGLADGPHTIVASETNAAGGTGSASLTLTLDRTAPAPVITGGAVANGQLSLTGTSGAADQISIYDGSAWVGFATTGGNGIWTFAGQAAAGNVHNVGINGMDLAGNIGRGTVNYVPGSAVPPPVTPDPVPTSGPTPTPTPTSTVVGITGIAAANEGVTLTGTSDPGAQISLYDGWNWLAFVTTGSNGNWTYSGKAASNTTHTYGINSTLAGRETHGAGQGVLGSSGADTLTGSSGSDVIDGGAGNDVLTGGAGADTFAFSAAPNATSNLDRISDFTSGTDKLAFARSAFAALSPGELSAAAFIQAAAAVTTDQHVIYNQPTGIVSYDADGSGGGTAIAVVQLKAGQVLTAQDIKVV